MSQPLISPPAPAPGAMAPAPAAPAPKDNAPDGAFQKALGAATSQQASAKDASKTSSSRVTKTGKGKDGRSKEGPNKPVKGQDPVAATLVMSQIVPIPQQAQQPAPGAGAAAGVSDSPQNTGPVQALAQMAPGAAVPDAENGPLAQAVGSQTLPHTTAPAAPVAPVTAAAPIGNPADPKVLTASADTPTPQPVTVPPALAPQGHAETAIANQAVPTDAFSSQQGAVAAQSLTSQTPGATAPSSLIPAGQTPTAAASVQISAHVVQAAPAPVASAANPASSPQGAAQPQAPGAPEPMAMGQPQSGGGQSASGDTNQQGQSNEGRLPGAQFQIAGQARTASARPVPDELRAVVAHAPTATSAPLPDSASAAAAGASQAAAPAVRTSAPPLASAQPLAPDYPVTAHVVEQVANAVGQSAARGVSAITVRLDPPDLGTLHVKLSLAGGELTAQVRADLPDTHQFIAANQHQIRDALQQAGVRLTDLHVQDSGTSFNSFGQHQAAQQWDGQQSAQTRTPFSQTPADTPEPGSSGVYQTDGRALMDSFA